MPRCFRFTNVASATEATLSILDEIGFWGVQASEFRAELDKVSAKKLSVEINSPGGDVFAGLAIYNMLKYSGKDIKTRVMGVAASAASIIMMAGDTREMPRNTFVMVHNAAGVTFGNADEHRATAELLDKIGDGLVATYVGATGMDEEKIRALLSEDTWMTADEALENGFATAVTDEISATAAFDMARADLPEHIKAIYASAQKTPEQLAAEEAARLAAAADQPVATAVNDLAIKAGLKDHAAFLAVASESVADGKARITAAAQIVAACVLAKRPDDAAALIRANKTPAEARAALLTAMAAADTHVVTTPPAKPSSTPSGASSGVTNKSIWDSHRKQTKGKKV
jgi:ATP-dependent Clp endopeptidase proteolytic subunit ClpP